MSHLADRHQSISIDNIINIDGQAWTYARRRSQGRHSGEKGEGGAAAAEAAGHDNEAHADKLI